ncbi:MAG: universal stress protein [Bacteroidia bacterium]|nr:universal stress protein [Bacteroidia bacterium]
MVGDKGHVFLSNTMDDAGQSLTEAKKSFEAAGIACTTEISVRGREPGEDIVQYAKENQIDLIIVGVRIRSRVGKLLLVILQAPCPVLYKLNRFVYDHLGYKR